LELLWMLAVTPKSEGEMCPETEDFLGLPRDLYAGDAEFGSGTGAVESELLDLEEAVACRD